MKWPSAESFSSPKTFFQAPEFRLLLRYCAPALLIGLALRIALTASLPYAYIQYDSADFLTTTSEWLLHHRFHIHPKRSFLTPVLFTLPFVLHLKPFLFIPVAQHLMGLWATLIVGSLVRFWFRWWKIAIIPITVIFAASPWIMWYEHTIMGEAQYLFFTLVTVWAGTLLARRPGHGTFAFFVFSLVLAMGTRLEAKLYFAFAFLLVAFVFWKQWRPFSIYLAALIAAAALSYKLSGKREGSGLAYATLIQLTPDRLSFDPELEPLLIPIRDRARKEFPDYPSDIIKIDKNVQAMVDAYVSARERDPRKVEHEKAVILRRLCIAAVEAHPVEALTLPFTKFALATDAWSGYAFDRESLGSEQQLAVTLKPWVAETVGLGAIGRAMSDEEAQAWVTTHYDAGRVAWFGKYQDVWNQARIAVRLPDRPIKQRRWVHDFYGGVAHRYERFPGMPIYLILAALGMVAACLRPRRLGLVHLAWIITMLGNLYVVSMVAVTNARFRFAYEPFFLIYAFLLFDCLAEWIRPRKTTSPPPARELAAA